MDPDTSIGGPRNRFPETRGSILVQLSASNQIERSLAWETVSQVYWKPLYTYFRHRWKLSNEDAKDLVQSFFQHAVEKGFLQDYDASQSAFRTFLRLCADRFAANQWQASQRLKRGGPAQWQPLLDNHATEIEIESLFHQEWVRSIFALSVAELEREQQGPRFEVFKRYDLCDAAERPSYASLGDELGLSPITVTNYLAAMRRRLRQIVLATLRQLTASDQEFRREARTMLGVEVE